MNGKTLKMQPRRSAILPPFRARRMSQGCIMQTQTTASAKPLDYLRLLIGATSAALASLAVVEARSWPMVVLTLGATEWGHVLAALALTPLLPGWRRTHA